MITEAPIDVSTVNAPDNLADLLVARDRELIFATVLTERPESTLEDVATGWPAATTVEPEFTEPDVPDAEPEQPATTPAPEVEPEGQPSE